VAISRELAENICELAKKAHPKEFIALLRGNIRRIKQGDKNNKILVLESLVYQTYKSASDVAVILPHFMTHTDTVGSVHSHPGPSNTPSDADKLFFSKNGMVHLIISRPYRREDIAMYAFDGRKIEYNIMDQE